jgi:hypothetical protein
MVVEQIGLSATLATHRMGHDSSGGMGGRGVGDDNSSNMQIHTLINHCGCRHPTVAMGHHSQLLSKQQSTNILCYRTTLLKLDVLGKKFYIHLPHKMPNFN